MPSVDSTLHQLLLPAGDHYTPSNLLSQRIEFVEPKSKDHYMEQLRLKYDPINPITNKTPLTSKQVNGGCAYQKDKVELEWKQKLNIGCGLINPANTCYLNSTLQCLLYTPPLINYLQADHKNHCKSFNFCVGCSLLQLYNSVHKANNGAVRPSAFIHHLKLIAKHFCFGRQEDAHEFLVHLRDKLIQQFLHSHARFESNIKNTPAHAIFGGKLVSTVMCTQCHHQSHTKECFLELGLDVRHSESIQQSLNRLCKKDTLSGSNAYKCERCKRSVIATKQFRIEESPNVLVLHLKRFQFGGFIGKLKNQISFPEHLDLSNWCRNKKGSKYNLYGVLVHAGSTAQCGHYYCYVRSHQGIWHCMNDAHVSTVNVQRVLNSEAYLLFYVRAKSPTEVHVNGNANGHPAKQKIKLLDKNPFFSDSTPVQKSSPIKFSMFSKSKLVKSPTVSIHKQPNSCQSNPRTFIGPLLPTNHKNSSVKKQITENGKPSDMFTCNRDKSSNFISKKLFNGKGPEATRASIQSESAKNSKNSSSLDIIKSSYDNDSDSDDQKVKDHSIKISQVTKLKSVNSDSKKFNIFDKLNQKSSVETWNGEKSKDFNNNSPLVWGEISNNPKKRIRDDYERELDEGKRRKFKHKLYHHNNNNNYNNKHAFQRKYEQQHKQSRNYKLLWKTKKHTN